MENNINKKYIVNNWLKQNIHNEALERIDAKGGAIALNESGELLYRLSKKDEFKLSKNYKAVSQTFSSFIGEDVELFPTKKKSSKDENGTTLQVIPKDLKLVKSKIFNPHANEEFIEVENGLYDLNLYIPTNYMQLECNDSNNNYLSQISATTALMLHLVNYDQEVYRWFVNWLAFFFQGLKKPQTSFVLKGSQGAGKEIFFKEAIQPLLGEKYTKSINDKSLNSSYLGGLVENTLAFNFDEISVKKSQNASIKNFLKALITNDSVTAEKKFKTIERATKIYGIVIITTNEHCPVEIEPGDRRFTVTTTGEALRDCSFLGYRRYETLSRAIEQELDSFIGYLKTFPVDVQMANTPLDTPEKEDLIELYIQKQMQEEMKFQPKTTKLQRSIEEFARAIRFKNLNYFESIRFDAPELYHSVKNDIYNDLFRISNLLLTFKIIYGNTTFKTTSEFLRELQRYDWYQFGTHKFVIVMINDVEEECLDIARYRNKYSL